MNWNWNLTIVWIFLFQFVYGTQDLANAYIAKDSRRCYPTQETELDWYKGLCKNWKFNWWETLYSVIKIKTDRMLAIQINGNYNWTEFEALLLRNPYQSLDFPEYLGPIKIVPVKGKGEGFIATANIQPGDLLIASKAIAHIFISKEGRERRVRQTGLHRDWKWKPDVTEPDDLDEEYLELHEQYSDKVGSMGSNSEQFKQLKSHFGKKDHHFEVAGPGVLSYEKQTFGDLDPPIIGVWFYPSYINHNCYRSNSKWRMYGDFMIVRATKHIRKGEEILQGYSKQTTFYEERQKVPRGWGFECDCELCQADRKEPPEIHQRRKEIHGRLHDGVSSTSEYVTLVEELGTMREMRLNYPLVPPVISFIEVLENQGRYKEAYRYSRNIYLLIKEITQFQDYEEPIPFIRNVLNILCNKLDETKYDGHLEVWLNELRKWIKVYYGSIEAARVVQPKMFSEILKSCDEDFESEDF